MHACVYVHPVVLLHTLSPHFGGLLVVCLSRVSCLVVRRQKDKQTSENYFSWPGEGSRLCVVCAGVSLFVCGLLLHGGGQTMVLVKLKFASLAMQFALLFALMKRRSGQG